jgi:tetratricopeptide (TPR) repeat protein
MIKYFLIAFLLPLSSQALEIKTEADTVYKKAGESATMILKKEDALKLENGDQVLFTGENQVPVLVVAPGKTNSTVVLTNEQQEQLMREATRKTVNNSVSEIVSKLVNLENLIKARNFPVAQTVIADLKTKYPQVAAVYFASGTTNFLLNKKTMAAADLEKGLELEPENPEAKKLLQRIKGGL